MRLSLNWSRHRILWSRAQVQRRPRRRARVRHHLRRRAQAQRRPRRRARVQRRLRQRAQARRRLRWRVRVWHRRKVIRAKAQCHRRAEAQTCRHPRRRIQYLRWQVRRWMRMLHMKKPEMYWSRRVWKMVSHCLRQMSWAGYRRLQKQNHGGILH